MVNVSKNRLANSGGYSSYSSSGLIFGSLTPNSKDERMKIFCCKFSVILSCINDKIPTSATPIITIKTSTIHEMLTLPDCIKLIMAWIPSGNDKLTNPAKMA